MEAGVRVVPRVRAAPGVVVIVPVAERVVLLPTVPAGAAPAGSSVLVAPMGALTVPGTAAPEALRRRRLA
ncbi:MAG: hypothetical protein WKG07_04985 [Hymenobacter sp.]